MKKRVDEAQEILQGLRHELTDKGFYKDRRPDKVIINISEALRCLQRAKIDLGIWEKNQIKPEKGKG